MIGVTWYSSRKPWQKDLSYFLAVPRQLYVWQCHSLTHWLSHSLTDWLTHSCLVNLIDVTLASEALSHYLLWLLMLMLSNVWPTVWCRFRRKVCLVFCCRSMFEVMKLNVSPDSEDEYLIKFCVRTWWYELWTLFVFALRPFLSMVVVFSASMGISLGKWPKSIKWPKITFPGSKMVPKVSKWGF